MKEITVPLLFTIHVPEGESFNEHDLPGDVWSALPKEWKLDEGEYRLVRISNRDTFGRIAILERANANQDETIRRLSASNEELRQEHVALKESLSRKNDEIIRQHTIIRRDEGLRDALSKAGSDRDVLVEQVRGMMKTLDMKTWGDDDDLTELEDITTGIKGDVDELIDRLDTIRTSR